MHPKIAKLKEELSKAIVAQEEMIDALMIALISKGHILIEGVPGLAKTKAITSLAKALDVSFCRIQFTPDLLPSDLIGAQIYNPKTHTFEIKKGPLFANLILADEINRAPAKVQSALLEAMQEGQITIAEETFVLPKPFLVMATQNPLEQEGIFPLPEAQLDRFMMHVTLDYPTAEETVRIMDLAIHPNPEAIEAIWTSETIEALQSETASVHVDEPLKHYIATLVLATRNPSEVGRDDLQEYVKHGAGPRGAIDLLRSAKAHALLHNKHYVDPSDIALMALPTLRHRIKLRFEAKMEGIDHDDFLRQIITATPLP